MPDDDVQAPDATGQMGSAPVPAQNMAQGSNTSPTLAPQGYQGPRPILMDLIQGLVKPRMQASAPGQPATPVSRAQTFENFLGNFVYALGQGFANEGHGPGAGFRGAGAAASAPLQLGMQQQQFQAEQAQRQAQTAQTQQQTAALPQEQQARLAAMTAQPRFDPNTQQYIGNMTDKQFEGYVGKQGAAKTAGTAKENIADKQLQAQQELTQQKADLTRKSQALDLQAKWDRQTRDLQTKLKIAAGAQAGAAARQAAKDQGLTTATRSMIEIAPTVKARIANMRALINDPELRANLGPGAGRWSEMWAGKIGATDPKFTQLRTEGGLLDTALMRMHVGARGGQQMLEHFKDLVNTGKQSPENMEAALSVMDRYADEKISEGQAGTALPPKPGAGPKKPTKALDPLGIR